MCGVAAVPEIVRHGKHGPLVAPRDLRELYRA